MTAATPGNPGHPGDRASAFLLFLTVTAVFYLACPAPGGFHWSESPRNALDGAFVLDLLRDLPLTDPRAWAFDYYLQYPALTILFYPPLLHLELAAMFAVFGVSHASALGLVALHAGILASGLYCLSRRIAPPGWAATIAIVTVFTPEMLLWGRQILLELPMLGFLVWSGWFWVRYLDEGRRAHLVTSVLLLILAIYTKQTAAFVAPTYLVSVLMVRGRKAFSERELWFAAAALVAALAPLAGIQAIIAKFNLISATDLRENTLSRWSWAGLSFYARTLIIGMTPLLTGLATLGFGASLVATWRGTPATSGAARPFLLLWIVSGYIALTLISLKEARHGLLIYPAFLAYGLAGLAGLTQARRFAGGALCGLLLGLAVFNAVTLTPPHVSGYREAAQFAVSQVQPGRRIAFSGNRDGAFIFNVRELDPQRRQTVVRVDKLLVRINILKELGIGEISGGITPEELASKLTRNGIDVLVVEPDFLAEVPSMITFRRMLASPSFELLRRILISAAPGVSEKELLIYRTRMVLPEQNEPLSYEIPTADLRLRQSNGDSRSSGGETGKPDNR